MKKKQLKSWLLCRAAMIVTFLGSVIGLKAEEKFYLPDFEILAGETKQLAIQFESERVNEYVAFQFDLYLPEGLTVVQKKGKYDFSFNTDRYDDHTFTTSVQGDGAIRVLAVSLTNSHFWEENGDFVYFSVTASEGLSGTHDIYLKNVMFSTVGSRTDFSDATAKVTVHKLGTNQVNIPAANKWATCILPFYSELPSGVMAFTSEEVNGDYLVLNETFTLDANTPYILYAEDGYEGVLSGKIEPTDKTVVSNGVLSGALETQKIFSGYVLQNQGSGSMFYKVNGEVTIPAGKCWLSVNSPLKSIRIPMDATGIVTIDNAATQEKMYTLDGMVVSKPQNGKIYILNGKKVIKL